MADDATRQHVGAVADASRVVADCRGGHAKLLQIGEAGNAGPVTPDPGIVEDRRGGAELRGEIGGVDPAMRGVDDDRTPGVGLSDPGDAVGNDDRRGGGGHRGGARKGTAKDCVVTPARRKRALQVSDAVVPR